MNGGNIEFADQVKQIFCYYYFVTKWWLKVFFKLRFNLNKLYKYVMCVVVKREHTCRHIQPPFPPKILKRKLKSPKTQKSKQTNHTHTTQPKSANKTHYVTNQ